MRKSSRDRSGLSIATPCFWLGIAAVVCILSLHGCASPPGPSTENFDKISVGMDIDDVIEVMGEPQDRKFQFNVGACLWQDGSNTYLVTFQDSKVVEKKIQ